MSDEKEKTEEKEKSIVHIVREAAAKKATEIVVEKGMTTFPGAVIAAVIAGWNKWSEGGRSRNDDSWFSRFFRRNRPELIIPFVGTSGVGKTQMINRLLGHSVVKIRREERTVLRKLHWNVTIKGLDQPIRFRLTLLDTPGETAYYRPAKERDLRGEVAGAFQFLERTPVVINVVANGYREGRVHHPPDTVFQEGGAWKPNQDFLSLQREHEMNPHVLSWMSVIHATRVITAVNKADVWWGSAETRRKILEWYTDPNSGYGKEAASRLAGAPHLVRLYAAEGNGVFYKVPASPTFSASDYEALHREFLIALADCIESWIEKVGQ